jgi:hypothetical protein
MVFRLPDHVVIQILIRIKAGQSPTTIHKALDVSRTSIYKIMNNIETWGQPYAPPTVVLGRERILADCHIEVRDTYVYGVVV